MTPALRQYADPSQLLMYEDPPELAQYAARGDLPMEVWPRRVEDQVRRHAGLRRPQGLVPVLVEVQRLLRGMGQFHGRPSAPKKTSSAASTGTRR